jgi:hypothetical protein
MLLYHAIWRRAIWYSSTRQETALSFATLPTIYQIARRHIPEDDNILCYEEASYVVISFSEEHAAFIFTFSPEDEGSIFHWNVGNPVPNYMLV